MDVRKNYDINIATADGTHLRSWWHRKAISLPEGKYLITVKDCRENPVPVSITAGEETVLTIPDCGS